MKQALLGVFAVFVLAASACGSSGGSGSDKDSVSSDSQADVSVVPDSETPDLPRLDTQVPDGDATVPDLGQEDIDDSDGPVLDLKPECLVDSDCDASFMKLTPCHKAVCNLLLKECEVGNAEDGTDCDDGDSCTGDDKCDAGVCLGLEDVCVCGDGECQQDEDCETCTEDCGKCSCCEAHSHGGCVDPAVQKCVCGAAPNCCFLGWDQECVQRAAMGCEAQCPPMCGDGACAPDETPESCEVDCWWDVCGDGACWEWETCAECPQDCGLCPVCGDGACQQYADETCVTCETDCGACTDDCCVAHPTPGCADEAIEACVCGYDKFCCNVAFDAQCVIELYDSECGGCTFSCGDGVCQDLWGETCQGCPKDCGLCAVCGNNVCEWNIGETCGTCAEDCGACPSCGDGQCNGADTCDTCAADCGVCPLCGDGQCNGADTCEKCPSDCGACPPACCVAQPGPGCASDLALEECVCGLDPFCCETEWDTTCVREASEDCGVCPPLCGDGHCSPLESCASCPGDCGECSQVCCGGIPEFGCPEPAVEACVCAELPECCEPGGWTQACAVAIELYECGQCPDFCGDGKCSMNEYCRDCPADCGACDFCVADWFGDICCQNGDPCGFGFDDVCDCMGACGWEVAACGVNVCGDGVCDPYETCDGCQGDCGPCSVCGDGVCTPSFETFQNCDLDCVPASCISRCTYVSGDSCQCDPECHKFEDCCPDKVEFCGLCGDGICGEGETAENCTYDCFPPP